MIGTTCTIVSPCLDSTVVKDIVDIAKSMHNNNGHKKHLKYAQNVSLMQIGIQYWIKIFADTEWSIKYR